MWLSLVELKFRTKKWVFNLFMGIKSTGWSKSKVAVWNLIFLTDVGKIEFFLMQGCCAWDDYQSKTNFLKAEDGKWIRFWVASQTKIPVQFLKCSSTTHGCSNLVSFHTWCFAIQCPLAKCCLSQLISVRKLTLNHPNSF